MTQLQTTPTINFFNTVVIGKFNPAILSSNFLLKNCGLDLGPLVRESRSDPNFVSEIVYQSCTWFMDWQRFQVQEEGLNRLEDFSSPEYVRQYLRVLPYTPITMAGINVNISYIHQDSLIFWKKLSDLNTIMKVVSNHGAGSCEVTYGNIISVSRGPKLTSVFIVFKTQEEAKIQLGITASTKLDQFIAHYNWEIGNIDKNPERLDFLVDNRQHIVNILPRLVEAFMGEDT